jgi:Tfp pilus assembly protein PilF
MPKTDKRQKQAVGRKVAGRVGLVRMQIFVGIVIALLTVGVYQRVRNYGFVNYDDPKYVSNNRHVLGGLTSEGVKWAFTTTHASNWHPLTWLSLMADCEFFEDKAMGCHITNVLLHAANALILFIVLRRMTGSLWCSGFVAALFALHPAHVESVAWVAERKDVLSTFFWMLTMLAYARYAERGGFVRYSFVVILFGLGLMTKPMLVTLPFVLLLLDWWPLERFGTKAKVLRLVTEKVPLFVMAAGSSAITLMVQQKAAVSLGGLGLWQRIANAAISYVVYLRMTFWPAGLAMFYPHTVTVPLWQAVGGLMVLAVVSAAVFLCRKRKRYVLTGLLWYLGTLVPVIGFVQVGVQRYADRYTYVPLIGIFIIIAWAGRDILRNRRYGKVLLGASAAGVLLVLAVLSWRQVGYWRDDIALYERTLAVTKDNCVAHNNYGVALREQGRVAEAIEHWQAALAVFPRYTDAMVNLGSGLTQRGQVDEAISRYMTFLQNNEGDCKLYNNLANALRKKARLDEAADYYRKALEFEDVWEAHCNLAQILVSRGEIDEAISHYRRALRLGGTHPAVREGLEAALAKQRELKKQ